MLWLLFSLCTCKAFHHPDHSHVYLNLRRHWTCCCNGAIRSFVMVSSRKGSCNSIWEAQPHVLNNVLSVFSAAWLWSKAVGFIHLPLLPLRLPCHPGSRSGTSSDTGDAIDSGEEPSPSWHRSDTVSFYLGSLSFFLSFFLSLSLSLSFSLLFPLRCSFTSLLFSSSLFLCCYHPVLHPSNVLSLTTVHYM